MNTQLIADAVRNSRGSRRSDHLGQAFRVLVSPTGVHQIWEDPELTLQRCNCRWDRRSSPSHPGGANALSYHGEAGAGLRHRPQ